MTICTLHRTSRFNTKEIRESAAELLRESAVRFFVRIHVFAISDDHIHLLISLPEGRSTSLAQWIGAAKTKLTQALGSEKIWQRSYYEHIVRNEADFLEKSTYIENHPHKEPSSVEAEWH